MNKLYLFIRKAYSGLAYKIIYLSVLLFSLVGYAQNVGDYRSKQNGDWTTSSTWEICTSVAPLTWSPVTAGYPGRQLGTTPAAPNGATSTVTITHVVTITNSLDLYFGDLNINPGGNLTIQPGNKSTVNFRNTLNVYINNSTLNFASNNLRVNFPANASVVINIPGGACNNSTGIGGYGIIGGHCSNQVELYIGGFLYTTCTGNGGEPIAGDFCDVNGAGGTVRAIASKNKICLGDSFNLSATQLSSVGYSWSLIPDGDNDDGVVLSPTNTREVLGVTPTKKGFYTFKVSVTKGGVVFLSDTVTIEVVDPPTDIVINQKSSCNVNYIEVEFDTYVTLSPITGLYRDSNLTIAYTANTLVNKVYTNSNSDVSVTATVSNGTCSKTNLFTINKVVRKEFTNNDGVWSNNGNWLPNGIPNITEHCVVIPNGKKASVNIPNAESKGLTVENGGVLVVETGMALKTQEQIINLGDGTNFTVENDGNLLQVNNVSNTGKITVKRNTSMKKNDYTYWGSPVEGQNLRAFSPGKLYTYNEWDDYFTLLNGTENFDSKAKGYAIQAGPTHQSGISTAFNGVFLGKPKNGNIVMTLKRVGRGYNLIGNPYPSNIDFAELYKANSDLIYNTAYFWTNLNHNPESQGSNYPNGRTINNYAILNGTGGVPATNSKQPTDSGYKASQIPNEFIKVGQGFIVRKKAAGDGDMIFNNAMRSNDNTGHFFRKKPRDRYWLELKTPLNIYTTLLVGYIENATNDFEIDYDATLMAVGSDAFYSVLGTRKLGIQGRESFVNTDVVALGTSHHENGEYTISAPTREGIFASSQSIYLRDKQTGITTDLTKGDYTFTANKGLSEGRFEIVYQKQSEDLTLGFKKVNKEDVKIFLDGDHFVAKSKTSKIMKIQLINVSGQYLISVSPELNEYKWSSHLMNKGLYVVKIQLENGSLITKEIVK